VNKNIHKQYHRFATENLRIEGSLTFDQRSKDKRVGRIARLISNALKERIQGCRMWPFNQF
jgi:hypothetical protein